MRPKHCDPLMFLSIIGRQRNKIISNNLIIVSKRVLPAPDASVCDVMFIRYRTKEPLKRGASQRNERNRNTYKN